MIKAVIFEDQNPQDVFNELKADEMRLTPNTTKAVVLARGPGIKEYHPEQWEDATKYGVNDIERLHKVKHLVALDDPFLLVPDGYEKSEWAIIEFLKQVDPENLHTNASGPMSEKKGYRRMRHKKFDIVGLWDVNYAPHWRMSAFTAAALAARHGHKEIVVYGVNLYGHRTLEPDMNYCRHGWARLHATMKEYGINLYIGHRGSALNKVLPLYAGAESG